MFVWAITFGYIVAKFTPPDSEMRRAKKKGVLWKLLPWSRNYSFESLPRHILCTFHGYNLHVNQSHSLLAGTVILVDAVSAHSTFFACLSVSKTVVLAAS